MLVSWLEDECVGRGGAYFAAVSHSRYLVLEDIQGPGVVWDVDDVVQFDG